MGRGSEPAVPAQRARVVLTQPRSLLADMPRHTSLTQRVISLPGRPGVPSRSCLGLASPPPDLVLEQRAAGRFWCTLAGLPCRPSPSPTCPPCLNPPPFRCFTWGWPLPDNRTMLARTLNPAPVFRLATPGLPWPVHCPPGLTVSRGLDGQVSRRGMKNETWPGAGVPVKPSRPPPPERTILRGVPFGSSGRAERGQVSGEGGGTTGERWGLRADLARLLPKLCSQQTRKPRRVGVVWDKRATVTAHLAGRSFPPPKLRRSTRSGRRVRAGRRRKQDAPGNTLDTRFESHQGEDRLPHGAPTCMRPCYCSCLF